MFVGVAVAIALEGLSDILLLLLAPLAAETGMHLVLTCGLSQALASFDFADDLEFELFGELSSLAAHGGLSS